MKVATLQRIYDEVAQAWLVAFKDMKVYYLKPGMIIFGFLMPFLLFFSFSIKREMTASEGIASLLALTLFFTAAAAGPFVIPLERRLGTYDRLLAAPMSLMALLLGKTAVGAIFAIVVATVSLLIGIIGFGVSIAHPWLLAVGILIGSFCFSALGMIFGSVPTRDPGAVQMPSTLLRWGLLFVSGVFIPLTEMGTLTRVISYLSPLTYAQDLMHHAALGSGVLNYWLDLSVLVVAGGLFMLPAILMHRRSRKLGY